MRLFVIISVILCCESMCLCWDLSDFGVDDNNYYVSSVAIYRSRAFLALPRSVCYNKISGPTLLETSWIDELLHSPTILSGRKILEYQQWGECSYIQDAVSLDIEHRTHRLWILDKGNELCQPKVVSYSLFFNSISETSELTNIVGTYLNILTIDREVAVTGPRAYVGNAGQNILLVFSLEKLIWWKVELLNMYNPLSTINVDYIATSKTGPELFITSEKELDLFALDLEIVRNAEEPSALDTEKILLRSNVTLIGKKLGKSRGLEADYKSGLSYFMLRDYAILRWLIGFPMRAEYHSVLAQSFEKLPFVSELFTGPRNGLWAIVNPAGPGDCLNLNGTAENLPELESRVVRIMRYNKFVEDLEFDEE